MQLEQLVRPFQSPFVAGMRRLPLRSIAAGPTTVEVKWGKAGNVPQGAVEDDGTDLDTVGYSSQCCDEKFKEKSRKTQKKKVYNKDDHDVFIEFNIIDSITFEKSASDACKPGGSIGYRAFEEFAIPGSAVYSSVKRADRCNQVMNLANPTDV
jgi:hypothetical protein